MKPLLLTFALGLALSSVALADPPVVHAAPTDIVKTRSQFRKFIKQQPFTKIAPLTLAQKMSLAGVTISTQGSPHYVIVKVAPTNTPLPPSIKSLFAPPPPPTLLSVNNTSGTYGTLMFLNPLSVIGGTSNRAMFKSLPGGYQAGFGATFDSSLNLDLSAPQANRIYLIDLVVTGTGFFTVPKSNGTIVIQGEDTINNVSQETPLTGQTQHVVFAFNAPAAGDYYFDIFARQDYWLFASCEITELPGS